MRQEHGRFMTGVSVFSCNGLSPVITMERDTRQKKNDEGFGKSIGLLPFPVNPGRVEFR